MPREKRLMNVIYFAPHEFPIAFNVLDNVPKKKRAFLASSIVDTFKGIFDLDFTASNIEMFVKAAVRVLLENDNVSLMGLNYMLTSPTYRKEMLRNVEDPIIRDFWERTFQEHMTDKEQRDRTISTVSKIFQLITDPAINNCLAQSRSAFNFADIIRQNKIFIACIPEGELGTPTTKALYSFIISRLHVAAIARKEADLFPVYADEFQYCAPMVLKPTFASWRKKGMALTLAHHYLSEVDAGLRDAIFGTVGTTVSFTVGAFDADHIAKLFTNSVKPDDLLKLAPFRAYASSGSGDIDLHMPQIDGKPSRSMPRRVRDFCRMVYSRPVWQIEAEIAAFVAGTQPKPKRKDKPPAEEERGPSHWLP